MALHPPGTPARNVLSLCSGVGEMNEPFKMALHAKDMRGIRNGRLRVIEPVSERGTQGGVLWRCICDCGGEKIVPGANLRKGDRGTRSCGCLTREANARRIKEKGPWNAGKEYSIGEIYT